MPGDASPLRGFWHLWWVAARRTFRSRQTVICLLLVTLAAMVVFAWSIRYERTPRQFLEHIFLPVYVTFLLPIICLCFATPSIAGDRDEGTLVYLLTTPLPRPLVYLAKYGAGVTLAVLFSLGSAILLSQLGGAGPRKVMFAILPPSLVATVAYVALFQLFSAIFRRATIVSLVYALFLETFVANVPGSVKRVAISFYMNCLTLEAGEPFGLVGRGLRDPAIYQPVSATTSWIVLGVAIVGLVALGSFIFSRKEYV